MEKELDRKLACSKILLVGVGGIGCEVLKYISKYKVGEVHIVDMDIIELTNLNRQFYFRKEHIGKYKADTAKEVISKIAPHLNIVAHNKSIMDYNFGVDFFAAFDCVLMALDNQQVRSYVNRMCCKTKVLIIESGTNGFSGQTYPIFPGITKCYDCYPKVAPKSYQVCTIRMLPTQIIHCLVWAKNIFSNLFENITSEGYNICSSIEKYIEIDKTNPHEVFFDEIFVKMPKQLKSTDEEKYNTLNLIELIWLNLDENALSAYSKDEAVYGFIKEFKESIKSLTDIYHKKGSFGFDKDDDVHVVFITAIANLRAFIYGIEYTDVSKTRTMVGNIIPAISSTNSQIAGLMVHEMLKIFCKIDVFKDLSIDDIVILKSNAVYVSNLIKVGALFCVVESINPDCGVCSHQYVTFRIDFNKEFNDIKTLIKSSIANEFEIFYDNNLVLEVYENVNPEDDDNSSKSNMITAENNKKIREFFKLQNEQKEIEILVIYNNNDDEKKLIITLVDSNKEIGCLEDMNVDNMVKMDKIYSTEITIFRDQKKVFKLKQDQQKLCHTIMNSEVDTLSLGESEIEISEEFGSKNIKKIKL